MNMRAVIFLLLDKEPIFLAISFIFSTSFSIFEVFAWFLYDVLCTLALIIEPMTPVKIKPITILIISFSMIFTSNNPV